ncbi:MAG TPA: hypothetical protein EYP86_05070 [Candidatus Altiarchaeales archaeon]|nr:hypothetical protein [Candidatus Altiarchaeales archaeon]
MSVIAKITDKSVTFQLKVVKYSIVLFHQITGTQFLRAIGVVKMRGSSHTESLHPMAITENGIVILREPFSEEFKIQ